MQNAVLNPKDISIFGLAFSAFARHYSRNLGWFLFLRVLRCFSSPRSPHVTMYSLRDHWLFISVVSQFGNLRIEAYLQLPAAYRSLSRPSSAPDAKAFTLCSFLLELLSLLSIAWVSQIIFTMKKLFSLRCNPEYFVFACEMRFIESQEIFLARCQLYFKFALTYAPCCAFLFLGSPVLSNMRPNCSFPRFSERPSKLFC